MNDKTLSCSIGYHYGQKLVIIVEFGKGGSKMEFFHWSLPDLTKDFQPKTRSRNMSCAWNFWPPVYRYNSAAH